MEKKTILLVEDHPADYRVFSQMIDELGDYKVVGAQSGAEALSLIKIEMPDCVLMDYSLPGANGLELLPEFKTTYPSLPVIVLTGLEDPKIAAALIKAGAVDFLGKDNLTPEDLLRALVHAISEAELKTRNRNQQRRLSLYYDLINQTEDPTLIFSLPLGKLFDINASACDRLGYTKHQFLSDPLVMRDVFSTDRDEWREFFNETIDTGFSRLEWELTLPYGPVETVDISGRYVQTDGEEFLIAVARDVGRHVEQRNELREQALSDALTGVHNRRFFEQSLADEWRRLRRHGHNLALLLIDIDFFKLYNDALGHQAGDECLQQVAAAMDAVIGRAGEFLARYGGEEFAVLLPESELADARGLAEKLLAAVAELEIPHPNSPEAFVSVSIGGAAALPNADRTSGALIAAADTALYAAKSSGRNRYVEYGSASDTKMNYG